MAKVQDTTIIHPGKGETWRKGEPAATPDGKTPALGCRQTYDDNQKQSGGSK
jgi:hypothetical protein